MFTSPHPLLLPPSGIDYSELLENEKCIVAISILVFILYQILVNCKSAPYFICVLLTKLEVKITGYWPSSFWTCLGTETQVHKLVKKERGFVKGLLCVIRGNVSRGTQRVVPNHSAAVDSSCPLTELAMY